MSARRPLRLDPIAEARRQWQAHGWSDAAPGMAAVTSVVRAHQIYMARVESLLRPLDLSFARYELLMVLMFTRRGELPLNKLGSRLQVHPTSVTNAVDRLEQQGLLQRVAHPTDGRTTLARITGPGRRAAAAATGILNTEVFSAPGLEPAEVEQLVATLTRLRQGAGDFEPAG
ncbi:MAG: MarR family transcriptional regulator [Actinomycetota bacterium]|nr:MarR family transcriptional regulator [Actinomycetota bacterium]